MGYLSKLVGQQFGPEMVADVTSAYDIYVFKPDFAQANQRLAAFYSMFLHAGSAARWEHVIPVDLRRQRGASLRS